MPREEDDDLYDEDYDFVDDDDDAEEDSASDSEIDREAKPDRTADSDPVTEPYAEAEEPVDEYGRPEPAANYVVHIYENKKFRRTVDRPFTPEDAEVFATEYNRTSKLYQRFAVAGKNDAKPKKSLD